MAYIGTEPKDVRSFGRAKFDYTATQGQTAFTGADDDGKTLGFTDGQMEVFVNGILMDESDFSTSNGNTVTLASAANLNDIISIVAMQTDIPNSDYVPISGGTFTGAVTASNGLTVDDSAATPLTVDRSGAVGSIIDVQKDGSTVGQVSNIGNDFVVGSSTGSGAGLRFDGTNNMMYPSNSLGSSRDNAVNLGGSSVRFKDLYLSSGIYLGGTGASNHLDDYEEGTWTPNIYKGSSALPVNSRYGYYRKVGGLLWMSFYWYHNGGLSSQTNNSNTYQVQGLPFTVVSLANSGYQFAPAGYTVVSNYTYYEEHRWQANATDTLTLYGARRQTAHTTGVLEWAGTGVFMTDA